MLTYISYGKKIFHRKEGIAADFCPICRQATPVTVYQVRLQNHVNHIGLGQGDLVGRLCRCVPCGSEWSLRNGTIQTVVQPTVAVSVETLLAETYPRFREVNAERLRLEATIRRAPREIDPETRLALMAEPFYVLDNVIENESKIFGLENMAMGTGCIVAILLLMSAVIAFFTSGPLWGFGLLIVAAGLGWGVQKMSKATSRRFMRDRIYPRLALALAPLEPNPDDLHKVIATLKTGANTSKAASRTDLVVFAPILEETRRRRTAV